MAPFLQAPHYTSLAPARHPAVLLDWLRDAGLCSLALLSGVGVGVCVCVRVLSSTPSSSILTAPFAPFSYSLLPSSPSPRATPSMFSHSIHLPTPDSVAVLFKLSSM